MAQAEPRQKSKRTKHDESVMGTNNSSIVSKRSVERLYYPEPHFFRHFVKKPQRRSPLINRGYWLRMHAIEYVLQQFLDEPSEKKKIVLNLGCGYDAVAFQFLSNDYARCHNTKFVDVDYPQLIAKKCETIHNTQQLLDLLGPVQKSANTDPVLLRSEKYMALGCNLQNIDTLGKVLKDELDATNCLLLCTAEVSITYMDVKAADTLIAWAACYDDARFCLLEQYFPTGAEHPFAKTMIQHFEKLQTPLKSVHHYPHLEDQRNRFLNAGWDSATARSLWSLWDDDNFMPTEQRSALNEVEPFDEWEEFALFASHYFLLVAIKNRPGENGSSLTLTSPSTLPSAHPPHEFREESANVPILWMLPSKGLLDREGHRRFGAVTRSYSGNLHHHGGLGNQSRLNSTDVYVLDGTPHTEHDVPPSLIVARVCHTMTTLDDGNCLLVGGRTSPDQALSDCWLRRGTNWERIDDLPLPLYRHCATVVTLCNGTCGVLVFGGKTTAGVVMNRWLIWRESVGWTSVQVLGKEAEPSFGAAMTATCLRKGMLIGGMTSNSKVCSGFWNWTLEDNGPHPTISIKYRSCEFAHLPMDLLNAVFRLGACLVWSPVGLLLIGGVSARNVLSEDLEIIGLLPINNNTTTIKASIPQPFVINYKVYGPRPLLVGHTVFADQRATAVAGGGAVCFSFGTYWNQGIWTLQNGGEKPKQIWYFDAEKGRGSQSEPRKVSTNELIEVRRNSMQLNSIPTTIPRVRVSSARDFELMLNQSRPVVLEGLYLGACTKDWTPAVLKTKVGADRVVVVHQATAQHMDFQKKNFSYITKSFGEFISEISEGSKQYLRSLASEQPTERPAELAIDYPELALDFQLPPQLKLVEENAHSSPLRISGPVTMWLHYDVMANVLCQIQGAKRLILYPPSDVVHLKIPPGASSSSVNVFDPDATVISPSLGNAHPWEAILGPGDVLFIPPLWAHSATSMENISVAVNVFFRSVKTGYAGGRDVYGNRDMQAYEKGRKDILGIAKSFDRLPPEMGKFYLLRLAAELQEKAQELGA